MAYPKRYDNRKMDQLRPIEAKAGVIKRADGSAYFRIGKTVAYAAVYGPRNLFPRFLQNPKEGIIRVNYNMMPFSGSGDRVKPGGSRRSKEISFVIEKALLPVLNLSEFPNSVVDVFIELPQTDAGTRCAGICAAAIALADAGIPMRELVAAVSVGRVDEQIVVDLDYSEEAHDGIVADIPVAFLERSKKVSLLQIDGELSPEQLVKALRIGQRAIDQIFAVQKNALKQKYNAGGNNE